MDFAEDDDEYEEAGGINRLLGFMFGNVDNSGDLDVDYLDEVICLTISSLQLHDMFSVPFFSFYWGFENQKQTNSKCYFHLFIVNFFSVYLFQAFCFLLTDNLHDKHMFS